MTNIPPFYVGQRVVAIVDHSQGAFKKGQEFIITQVLKGCCNWVICIGICSDPNQYDCETSVCNTCEKEYISGSRKEWPFAVNCFAPIHTDYQEIKWEELITFNKPCAQ